MFEERINRLVSAMKAKNADAVLIASPENRFFFSGFTGETGALLITEASRTLFVEQRFALLAAMETKGFNIVNISGGLYNSINDTILAEDIRNIIYEDDFFSVSTYRSLRKNLRNEELIPAGDLMLRLRAVKDESEIELIKEAAGLADEAMGYACTMIKVGAVEKEIILKLKIRLMEMGVEEFPFEPTVVSGVRSAMPSGTSGIKEIEFGDIVIVDIGILYKGYFARVCRTFFMGSVDDKGRELFDCAMTAAEAVLEQAKAGVPCRSVDMCARNIFAEKGFREGYIHGVGNGVGISVRELPIVNLRSSDTLCKNMAVSLGAGCYEGGFGGVRMTDTVIILDEKCEKLTKFSNELTVL